MLRHQGVEIREVRNSPMVLKRCAEGEKRLGGVWGPGAGKANHIDRSGVSSKIESTFGLR